MVENAKVDKFKGNIGDLQLILNLFFLGRENGCNHHFAGRLWELDSVLYSSYAKWHQQQ